MSKPTRESQPDPPAVRPLAGSRKWAFPPDGVAIAAIASLAVVFLAPALLSGASSVVGSVYCDALSMFYPLRSFANGELQSGRLPLWNPYVFCGHPFHAEGQGAVFYPLNLLFAPLPAALSMNLFAALHFVGAGVFFYLYLREIRIGVFASFLGALTYCLSPALVSRFYAGHYTIMPFLALIPALLWLFERWRRRRGMGALVSAALVYGSMILAGFPQLVLYSTIYLGLHALFAMGEDAKRAGLGKAALEAAALASVVLAGAAVGAVQLFPSYDFARYSFRQQATYQFCASFSFAPENLVTLLAPTFFGDLVTPGDMSRFPYWGRRLLWEMWIYVGVAPLALGLMAAGRVRSRVGIAHTAALPVFALLALGAHTPLFRLLYNYAPFFKYFRGTSRFMFFAQISLCALAAMGAQRILEGSEAKEARGDRWRLLMILGLMLAIAAGLLVWFGRDPQADGSAWRRLVAWRFEQGETGGIQFNERRLPPTGLAWDWAAGSLYRLIVLAGSAFVAVLAWNRLRRRPGAAKAALFLLAIPDLWHLCNVYVVSAPVSAIAVAEPFVSAIHADKEPARVLSTGRVPNAFPVCRLETPRGYSGNITWRYNNFLTAVSGAERDRSMVQTPLLTDNISRQLVWANVRYVIQHRKTPLAPDLGDPIARCADEVLYRLKNAVPRAYFSANATLLPTAEAALEMIESGWTTVFQTDLIETADSERFAETDPPAEGDRIEFLERRPGRVVLATTASGPRILALIDSFDPNWRCRIDGQKSAAIYPLNIAFRAVITPGGKHRVEFYYAPRSFYWGLATTSAALLAAVGLMAFFALRKRSAKP